MLQQRQRLLLEAWLLALGFLSFLAWRSINYDSGTRPGQDSGGYLSAARHIMAGRTLYKDVWDHKPPFVHFADALAMSIGDHSVNSVKTLERIFAVVGLLAFIAIASLGLRLRWLACLAGAFLLLHFYDNPVFELGNLPEEYGAILFTLGLAAATAAVVLSGGTTFLLSALAGTALSASILCKEPFLLYLPPLFLFIAWAHRGDWRASFKRAASFFAGAALPLLAFLTYLLTRGAWRDWLDVVAFNFAYRAPQKAHLADFVQSLRMANQTIYQPLILTRVLAALGILSLFRPSFIRATSGLPILLAALTALGLLATTLSGRYYGHYYLQLVPVYLLLAACGAAFLLHLISDCRARVALALAALVALAAFDGKEIKAFADRLAAPSLRWEGDFLSGFIRSHTSPADTIWCPWEPYLYSATERLSPTKWHYALSHLFIDTPLSTRGEKLAALAGDLMRHPPRMIVFTQPPGETRETGRALLASASLPSWIAGNYWSAIGTADDDTQVLILNSPGDTPATRQRVAAELMQAGLDCLYAQGDLKDAELYFRSVLRIFPRHSGAQSHLAKTIATLASRTAENNPTPNGYLNLSRAYYSAGLYEESISAARQAIKLSPDCAEAYSNIGAAYNAMRMWEAAIAPLEQALRISPGFQLARGNLDWARINAKRPPGKAH